MINEENDLRNNFYSMIIFKVSPKYNKIVAGCLNITKGDDKSKNIGKYYSMIICICIYL